MYYIKAMDELKYRELFYKTTQRIAQVGRRKSVDEKTRRSISLTIAEKQAELQDLEKLLLAKGTKPLYGLTYNIVYANYRRDLKEEIGRLEDQLKFG